LFEKELGAIDGELVGLLDGENDVVEAMERYIVTVPLQLLKAPV